MRQQTMGEFFQPLSQESSNDNDATNSTKGCGMETTDDEIIELFSSPEDCKNSKELPAQKTDSETKPEIISLDEDEDSDIEVLSTAKNEPVVETSVASRKRSRELDSSSGNSKDLEEPKTKTAKKSSDSDTSSTTESKSEDPLHKKEKEKHSKSSSHHHKKPTPKGLINDLFGSPSPSVSEKDAKRSSSGKSSSNSESDKKRLREKSSERVPPDKISKSKSVSADPCAMTGDKKRSSNSSNSSSSSRTTNGDDQESTTKGGDKLASVQLNGVRTTSSQHTTSGPSQKIIDKQGVAEMVVNALMPYYRSNKFESKDKFKEMARDMSHQAMKRKLKSKCQLISYTNYDLQLTS